MKKEPKTIIVIPAEGDSVETEAVYVRRLKNYYNKEHHEQPNILVFEHDYTSENAQDVVLSTIFRVREFTEEYLATKKRRGEVEIHAQGGLGALVACEFLYYCPGRIDTVFMVGGAPCDAMTWVAKVFHQKLIYFWYAFRWLIPFFADDPNPTNDAAIEEIKVSSTTVMRTFPKVYRNQLAAIGEWHLPSDWQVPRGCKVYYVPNGETVRPKWWDNTYDDAKAKAFWVQRGVLLTERPGNNFSFYSLMPARELFKVMDKVR